MNNEKVNIAILGLGTIGFGVYKIIEERLCDRINVKKIFDKDFSKNDLVGGIITSNYDEIIQDDSIKIVVETLGGLDFPYNLIKKAIVNSKSVVSANKEVIAKYIKELTILKDKMNVNLSYEASVGGGVPIIKNLIDVSNTNDITSISGIINGTTNFILTRLSEGMEFDEALKLAREKGFAEADASYDLDGFDMARKIAILCDIALKEYVDVDKIYRYSIKDVSLDDFKFVKKMGFSIKYLASFENGIISVEPRLVKGMYTYVNDEYNLISVDASNYTNLKFYGKGAGRFPTANAIVNDIVDIINNNHNYTFTANKDFEFKEDDKEYIFFLRLKDINKFDKDLIYYSDDKERVITKNIKMKDIDFDNVIFYAKAK